MITVAPPKRKKKKHTVVKIRPLLSFMRDYDRWNDGKSEPGEFTDSACDWMEAAVWAIRTSLGRKP